MLRQRVIGFFCIYGSNSFGCKMIGYQFFSRDDDKTSPKGGVVLVKPDGTVETGAGIEPRQLTDIKRDPQSRLDGYPATLI